MEEVTIPLNWKPEKLIFILEPSGVVKALSSSLTVVGSFSAYLLK
jgi:hypothetical protein